MSGDRRIFISHSSQNAFEASLLQYATETMLSKEEVTAWTFQRDQSRSEQDIARSLKERIRESAVMLFLLSPETLDASATQWMELAYADAFEVPIFILLHRIDYQELKRREYGVPPLPLASQCNPASSWKEVVKKMRDLVKSKERENE